MAQTKPRTRKKPAAKTPLKIVSKKAPAKGAGPTNPSNPPHLSNLSNLSDLSDTSDSSDTAYSSFSDIIDLAPKSQRVRIGDEICTIREMTGAELQKYIHLRMVSVTIAKKHLSENFKIRDPQAILANVQQVLSDKKLKPPDKALTIHRLSQPNDLGGKSIDELMAESIQVSTDAANEMFAFILGKPVSWVAAHLTNTHRLRILNLQDAVNGMEESLKNLAPLLQADLF